MLHTKEPVTVTIDGKERTRTKMTCAESGQSFTLTRDGQNCPFCGQMFNLMGQRITHKGY